MDASRNSITALCDQLPTVVTLQHKWEAKLFSIELISYPEAPDYFPWLINQFNLILQTSKSKNLSSPNGWATPSSRNEINQ